MTQKSKLFWSRTLIVALALILASNDSFARVQDFETTRMKSTAGAGVGSMLMDEATVLNPAPIAFFQTSSLYVQKTGGETISKDPFVPVESKQIGVIASDSKGKVAGSISMQKQTERFDERKRFGFTMSSVIGKQSAVGITYRITEDILSNDGLSKVKDKYNQTVLGISHAATEDFTIGLVLVDPLKVKPNDTRLLAGVQYIVKDMLSVMLDVGADYNDELSSTVQYRAAAQIKAFTDFYARFGFFRDRALRQKGSGVGLGWVQPKLVLEFAIKNSTLFAENFGQDEEKVKETSFSLSFRF